MQRVKSFILALEASAAYGFDLAYTVLYIHRCTCIMDVLHRFVSAGISVHTHALCGAVIVPF